ncbi:MAG: aminotransferase class I/II-fold pyridoxal phosphate-dependent enzyme [Planctomycetota bacterium]
MGEARKKKEVPRSRRISRRGFLKPLAGLGALSALPPDARAARPEPRLALEGGEPVRRSPLRARLYGPLFFDGEERNELDDVLRSRSPFRWWGSSDSPPEKVRLFEAEFAAYLGVAHALGVTSGTTALMTALAALEVGPGDEVILPAWTWYADYDAIVLAGATPVFAEIDESFDIDPEDAARRVTPRTKAIIACHLQGTPCDLEPLVALARARGIRLLEDCAQAVGARYRGKPVGSFGDIAIFSFQVNKTITAGEGGAVVTNDPKLFERALRFHDVGTLREPYRSLLGGGALGRFVSANFRMSEFTGAVLRAQLRKLARIADSLRRVAGSVRRGIEGLPELTFRKTPDPEGDLGVAVYLDLKTAARRERFSEAMAAENVPASGPSGSAILPIEPYIREKKTVHPSWPSFAERPGAPELRYGPETCPRTIDILGRHAGVILDPLFTEADVADIVAAVRKVHSALA